MAHCYADDTQVYLSSSAPDTHATVGNFQPCVEKIEEWLRASRLKMNSEKTQVIFLGTRQQLAKVDIDEVQLLSTKIPIMRTVVDLGFMIDSRLTMSDHVAAVRRSCFFQLRQLRASITATTCMLAGVGVGLLRQLQSVQNAAARLVTGLLKFDHITQSLRELHWLPVRKRIEYKVALLVFKCLHGLAPPYLAADCRLVSSIAGRRQLRSADTCCLVVPRTHTAIGSRSFAVYGPTVWNGLPAELRCSNLSVKTFAARLKTALMES
jgi:hypothetical protein